MLSLKKRPKSSLTSLLVFKSSLEKPTPMPDFMKWIVKNVVKWRNNAKIKRVQPQPPPFQHENVGKTFQTWNFG
jgi:hypothetical protein